MSRRAASESATVVVAADVLATAFGTEYVLLNLNNGTYYGLDTVGAEIWKLVQVPITVGDISRQLVEMFDVDRDRCLRDVTALVSELAHNGLVEIRAA